uniref:B-cell receptor CD22 n=1 Tax=Cyprinus carpio TaxID=7962 RepID=A0A8C2BUD6_CYPCA
MFSVKMVNDEFCVSGVSSAGWGVSYRHSHICALKNSSVIMSCTYTYPTGYNITKVFWTKNPVKCEESPDLSEDPEYSQRLQYLGDKQQSCTIRLSHVTQKDSQMYCFRFITNDGKWIGKPGVTLTVTDLQVEAPERVTEGHNVSLTCKSSCTLTDRATFIWYRNSQPLTERRDRNNQLLLQSVRREDAGRYSCALHGHSHISPAAHLNVTYPPRNVSVFINGSGVIVEGDSVTLICSSDSNPPALNFSWFKENQSSAVGSGQSFSALQSGRFYCEAHNQHGSQRSDAVTVIVKGGHNGVLYTAVVIAVGCGVLFLICIIMFMRKRKGSAVSDVRQMQLQQPSSSDRNHFEDGLYANRTDQTAGKTPESTDTMKLKYTTIQHIRNNESNYENLRIHHPDSAVRSVVMMDKSVIYSTVK